MDLLRFAILLRVKVQPAHPCAGAQSICFANRPPDRKRKLVFALRQNREVVPASFSAGTTEKSKFELFLYNYRFDAAPFFENLRDPAPC